MTLDEFIEKHQQDLMEFVRLWKAQRVNEALEFPDWMDYFWGWCENKWEKEQDV